ncbi:pilus assembly FimT family protein [Nocardioides sp. P5_E3]|jgi:Tfp pilus assembly protein FimT
MSTPAETQSPRERSWIFIVVLVLLAVITLAGVLAFSRGVNDAQAQNKANELVNALTEVGARTPDVDQVARVLGDDGGATCENPNEALSRAVLLSQLTNGATGPGQRPVIADSRVVQGQLLIIQIYCPDELDDFKDFVGDLKTDDVAGS